MRGVSLKFIEEGLIGRAQNVMNFVNLVKFIVTGEEWEQRDDFEHDTADSPQIHLVAVVAICEKALRRTVPSSGDILCVGLLRINATA